MNEPLSSPITDIRVQMAIADIRIGTRVRRDLGDIKELADNIAEVGLLHPVVVRPDGLLIAGERRISAFERLGRSHIPVTIVDLDKVVRGEYAENIFRKAFTPEEMGEIAKAIEPMERAKAKERQQEGGRSKASGNFPEAGNALDKVARVTGVSRKTLTKAMVVVDAAKANPGKYGKAKEQMNKSGKVDGAYKKVVREQKAAENAEKAKAIPAKSKRYRLVHGSVDFMLKEPAASADFVITDPPYPEEFVPLFGKLARGAAHILKPGGVLLCMSGQSWLPRVFEQLENNGVGLNYVWTLAYQTPGGQAVQVHPRKVNTFWKPVLLYCKGPYTGDWYGDVTRSDVNDNDKEHHHWGQSASGMHDLMKRFVRPGSVVVDPFLGGGTTALVALHLGATVLGFDTEQSAIDATKARIADVPK